MHELKNVIRLALKAPDTWQAFLLTNWSAVVGDLNSKVYIEKIEGSTLVLGVYDSCWLQELSILSDLLLEIVNKHLANNEVKELRFKKGIPRDLRGALGGAEKKMRSEVEDLQKRSQVGFVNDKAFVALQKIDDPELREILRRLVVR